MFTHDFLQTLGPLLVEDNAQIFGRFVTECLGPQWTLEVSRISGLLDFRDYVEDTLRNLDEDFGQAGMVGQTGEDSSQESSQAGAELYGLLKASKTRKDLVLEHLKTKVSAYQWTTAFQRMPAYVQFYLDCELQQFFTTSSQIVKYRPLLSCPVEDIELALSKLSADLTVQSFIAQSEFLKTSLLAVLGLYVSSLHGETEDAFLHVPMPRVFGSPMAIKESMSEQKCNFKTLVKSSAPLRGNFLLAGSGYMAYKTSAETDEWQIYACDKDLVAPLPGLKKHIWALCPKTMQAGIYAFDSKAISKNDLKPILDFELPNKAADAPNWIDCQRDSEGSLVLIWGHINPLTGSSTYESMVALDEDFQQAKEVEFLDHIAGMPNRRALGARIDWRDHGNVLSAYHTVKDQVSASRERTWLHKYDICFAQLKLMTIETQSRPIQSLFGGPHDFYVLSPLSSRHGIQQWTLSKDKDSVYSSTYSCSIPKHPNGLWSSFCVMY